MVKHCAWFVSHVTQVEVDMFELEDAFKQYKNYSFPWKQQSTEKARFFWDVVQEIIFFYETGCIDWTH
jgi:hypothetical protein